MTNFTKMSEYPTFKLFSNFYFKFCNRLPKKKGSCRILIVRWAWLFGNTSSPHWNPSQPLLHAVQHPRNHGQKPSRTMYRVIWWDRVWAILGGQDKNYGKLTSSLLYCYFCDYSLLFGFLC